MVPVRDLLMLLQAGKPGGDQLVLVTKILALSIIPIAVVIVGILLVRKMFQEVRKEAQAPAGAGSSATPSPDSTLPVSAFQSVFQRVRDQEKELERLRRSERQRMQDTDQLSATIMRNMATGVLILNAQGIITDSNPAAKAVLGHQLLVGRTYRDVFGAEKETAEPPPIIHTMELCLRTGTTFRRNVFNYRSPQGNTKVLGVGLSPILNETQVGGLICLIGDLTEITALQQQVRLKENLAALGEMAAGIAHEFKNSLATISGYAQLIRDEETVQGAREHAAKIVSETRFLTQIVTDFLNFSRPLNVVATDVYTRDLIEETFADVVSRGAFTAVSLDMSGEFPTVSADQTLLRQCFSNLLRNSCEAIAERGGDGRVTVQGRVEGAEGGAVLKLKFADNGPGIDPPNLEKLFIPFFTTKNAGTGLGLALVHKIVVNHNGKISVANEPGGGAAFTITLPVRSTSVSAAPA